MKDKARTSDSQIPPTSSQQLPMSSLAAASKQKDPKTDPQQAGPVVWSSETALS